MEPTLTPTPLPTPNPYLHEIVLSSGQLAGVYYTVNAGQAVMIVLWLVVIGLFAVRLLVELRRARN